MSALWHYGIVKQARKLGWRAYAKLRAAFSPADGKPKAGPTAYGVKMIERWHDRTYVYCRAGTYGRFLADYLEHQTQPFVFVDIGANQGLYSMIAASNAACAGVIAFEPVKNTHELLLANAALNGADERINALRMAISDQSGPVPIAVPSNHSGMAALGDSGDIVGPVRNETVQAVTAAELEVLLAGDIRLIVKVDVEGHERVVFGQLLATRAARRIDAVFYEIDRRWSDDAHIETLLRRAGFGRFTHVGIGRHFDVLAERYTEER